MERRFIISKSENERASAWFRHHECKDPVSKDSPIYPLRSSIGGGCYYCFEPTGLYVSFSVQCVCGMKSGELSDPGDL